MPTKKKRKPTVITQKEIDTEVIPIPWAADTFEAEESETFRKIGDYVPYRENQNAKYMPNVVAQLGIKPEHHVLDVGCGIGKNAAYLCDQGINVHGIDIAMTLNDDMYTFKEGTRNKFYFTQNASWSMAPGEYDFVVCTFLLENLPFVKIDPTLYLIDKGMKKGGFFAIATELEPYGPKHLNKQLHRTVQTGRYWADILSKRWRISWEQTDKCFLAYVYPRKEKTTDEWPTGY